MNINQKIHQLRLVAGVALVGCVLAGCLFGWLDLPFDPRIEGATLGAIVGVFKFVIFA